MIFILCLHAWGAVLRKNTVCFKSTCLLLKMKESKYFLPKQGFNAFFPQAITGLQAVGPWFTKRVYFSLASFTWKILTSYLFPPWNQDYNYFSQAQVEVKVWSSENPCKELGILVHAVIPVLRNWRWGIFGNRVASLIGGKPEADLWTPQAHSHTTTHTYTCTHPWA